MKKALVFPFILFLCLGVGFAATINVTSPGSNETWCTGYNNDNYRNGFDPPLNDRIGVSGGYRFGSAHPSTWHMAYCDGHVESLTYDVDQYVHRAACNRHDGAVDFEGLYVAEPGGPVR